MMFMIMFKTTDKMLAIHLGLTGIYIWAFSVLQTKFRPHWDPIVGTTLLFPISLILPKIVL